ncbi:MAG TPA: hypothetical protein DEF12_15055 [Rhodobacteraceae bacterium]|jgi:hypothetical protein|nr:hypothetical protein [Paracoccaceae bacterium]HBV56336.1 hypothetical protein [Paracoccaceae bacterium]
MKALPALCFAVLMSACAPVSMWYRVGETVSTRDQVETRCDVTALRDAPRALETRLTPLRFVPLKTCDAAGVCVVRYEMIGGEAYSVDINADLRGRVMAQCMNAAGYTPVSIPACPPATARNAPEGATTTLPRLTPKSCAISRPTGMLIVTRG